MSDTILWRRLDRPGTGETTYRYASAGGRFVRTVEVDASGFVTGYPGLWEAEAG